MKRFEDKTNFELGEIWNEDAYRARPDAAPRLSDYFATRPMSRQTGSGEVHVRRHDFEIHGCRFFKTEDGGYEGLGMRILPEGDYWRAFYSGASGSLCKTPEMAALRLMYQEGLVR